MVHGRNLPDGTFVLTIRAGNAHQVARALCALLTELDAEVERQIDGQLVRIVKLGKPATPGEVHVPICGALARPSGGQS